MRFVRYTAHEDDWGFERAAIMIGECDGYIIGTNGRAFLVIKNNELVDAGLLCVVAARYCPRIVDELVRRVGVGGALSALSSAELPRDASNVSSIEELIVAASRYAGGVEECSEWAETMEPPFASLICAARAITDDFRYCVCGAGKGVVIGGKCYAAI